MINDNYFYAWEKYYLAALTLASGSWSLEERLYDVWISHIMGRKADLFPPSLREKHQEIYDALERSAKPLGIDMRGSCSLGEWEEKQLVDKILSVFIELIEIRAIAQDEEDTLRMMKSDLGLD